MMMTFEEMQTEAISFLGKIFKQFERDSIALDSHWHIDHLCYRTATADDYLNKKREFEKFSRLLIESEVNGRPISTFKLATPITFGEWDIDLIEVPAPKKGKSIANGFEHIEVVCDLTFNEIKNRFKGCRFDDSGLAKDFNQELEITFDGIAVKFHHLSLESVINIEANRQVYSALHESKVLKVLKQFNPLVAGTFPLNVSVVGSDVDILISGDDFELMKNIIVENFSSFLNFKFSESLVRGKQTYLAVFSYKDMQFEIFAQKTASVKQEGYLHFLAEERLLKIGGKTFANKVIEARSQGLKTEPAFAKALGLSGDSYIELLSLQKKSNQELKRLCI